MAYDVAAFRALFPALADGTAFFDGPGGTQTPTPVAGAIARTLTAGLSNRATIYAAGRNAEDAVTAGRTAMADLLGADPAGIVFGRSMTQLTFDLARTLAQGTDDLPPWGPGDEIVVSRLDHDANIRPWVTAADRAGATVRWVDFDPTTGDLTPDHVAAQVTTATRVVALTAAGNILGTRPDLPAAAQIAHDHDALFVVDGVHATAHVPTDVEAEGADVWLCSPYKFLGPHCGVLAAAPTLLETLHPDKLLPSPDVVPERFELGTLPYEFMAGTAAAVEVLARLGDTDTSPGRPGEVSPGRDRVLAGMAAVHEHEEPLLARIEDGLARLGATVYSRAERRTPTLLFQLPGIPDADVMTGLAERGVNAPASHFYALECSRHLGLGDTGAVRVGLAPYTDDADVDALLAGLADIAGGA
ncbi:MAG: cysteine desulfurase-like protein [Mobilicoccus sp.]|nr:cysteine desulfurase-like protein [Mobilicoccus sp.]